MQTRVNARRIALLVAILTLVLCSIDAGHPGRGTPWRAPTGVEQAGGNPADPRLKPAYRFEKGGWVYVHLEGTPGQIGFQHGYLLAPEIADAFAAWALRRSRLPDNCANKHLFPASPVKAQPSPPSYQKASQRQNSRQFASASCSEQLALREYQCVTMPPPVDIRPEIL